MFRSYGITLWYPTYVNEITTKKDAEDFLSFCNKSTSFPTTDNIISYCDCSSSVFEDTFVSDLTLMKWRINDVLFRNVTFLNVTFDSVLFNGTEFMNCTFENCTFVELFFHNTDFDGVRFQLVNILPSSLCLLSNHSEGTVTLEDVTMNASVVEFQDVSISELRTSLQSQVESVCSEDLYSDLVCRSDDLRVYRDSFIVSISGLPGYIVSAFAVYYLPRNYWLGKYYSYCNAQLSPMLITTCFFMIICHCTVSSQLFPCLRPLRQSSCSMW